jgi:hypothetical protein
MNILVYLSLRHFKNDVLHMAFETKNEKKSVGYKL